MTIQTPLQLVITIGIIALGTFLIRALPFFLFPAGTSGGSETEYCQEYSI